MYPIDIDPQSGCRLPLPDRASLDTEAQAIFDAHVKPGAHSIRGLRGPGGLQLHSPELAKRNRPLLRYLRFEAAFSPRVREVAILTTARCCDSQFEWAVHEAAALSAGVPEDTIDAIRRDRRLAALDQTDALVITLGREIFRAHRVSSRTYERALKTFGKRSLIDLVALMGNYSTIAALLATFDMQLDPGVEPPLATS
jgi:4-carboxymuconolactone decarboxylase